MSRKKTQPKKNVVPDPKFKSTIIPKLINNIMYDGKRGIAAKIVYDAIDKIKSNVLLTSNKVIEQIPMDNQQILDLKGRRHTLCARLFAFLFFPSPLQLLQGQYV